jgi:pyruvate dehydrogenase E1 component alpha subunit
MKVAQELTKEKMVDLYRMMQLIRVFEEQAGSQYMRGKIRGFLHLYIGEEAIAAGAISTLGPDDYVITHYRDHGHALARGIDPKSAMAELFGRATGSSKGKGGSMHLFDASINFMGGYAIVGGQLPIATGLGLAEQYKGTDNIVLCFLGDGALNEGEFHEAMNIAAIWHLPIIFFCENNLYGMGSPVSDVFAVKEIYRMAEAYEMPGKRIDGMDVLAVREAMTEVVDWVRSGNGPYFVEGMCYRFRGHSMADPSEYRHKDEEEYWKTKDPIATLRRKLIGDQIVAESDLNDIDLEVEQIIDEAVQFADESPEPGLETLYDDILA